MSDPLHMLNFYEGEALMNGISALIKETPESSLALTFLGGKARRKWPLATQKSSHQNSLCWLPDLQIPAS